MKLSVRHVGLACAIVWLGGCAFGAARAPVPTASATAEPAPGGGADVLRALSDLDALRREVKSLENRVEIQRHELQTVKRQQADMVLRLQQPVPVNSPDTGLPANTIPPATPPPPDDTNTAGTAIPSIAGVPAPPDAGAAGQAPVPAVAGTVSPELLYEHAFQALKQGRYDEATAGFEQLLASYPASDVADDSQYWIGEAAYVNRNYDAAASAFQAVIQRYPNSERAPTALLKLGYIQYETGDYAAARKTLTGVITRYPNDQAAISADARLDKMSKEGH